MLFIQFEQHCCSQLLTLQGLNQHKDVISFTSLHLPITNEQFLWTSQIFWLE